MDEPLYRPVDARVSFPKMEEALVASWKERDVFHRQLEARKDAAEWVFYEGPPTANNKPGIHHIESRTFKDIFPRFQAMRGRYVYRKAGWDCHGLPVEVAVEKELGINHKRQIEEEIGIEAFTRRCRESVERYVEDWEKVTDRIGFWVDLEDAYWTMSADYVETVWWLLKQIWDKGLLEEDFKVVPYCPRCETALSSHEQHMTGAYQTVTDPSVYVRFPLAEDENVALLVWTTTPWTLLSNMAVAAGPDITYAEVDDPDLPGKRLIVAEERIEALLAEGATVHRRLSGAELIGDGNTRYIPPFDFVHGPAPAHTVRPGDFVTTEDGSGMVHLAPYGEEDMSVAKRDNLPIVQMINGSGEVVADPPSKFAGMWIKDADKAIVEDLKARDVLFRSELYEHAYPHCWRCGTPLLYYARKDWYIRTSQIRSQLEASNEETNWQPPTIKYGRFGDWLANNVDWSLSRDRYWGTPLPIWRCEQGHATCVGSFAELGERAGRDLGNFDPHRPHVDDITFPCPECRQEARRVPSVIDAWFDSGAMPFGQWHYPFENTDVFERRFPADFISEAIDQTRGWFYSLTAVATLVRGHNSYRNVVCLGHIVDAEGRKMSKSLGNVIDPWSVLNAQGADALRWYMLTSGTPWSPRRVSPELIEEALRKYLLTLWNTYSFWVTYASLEGFDPSKVSIPVADRSETDRWILAELDDTIRVVTDSLEAFDATSGGKRLDRFVDDLSNWYVRRSRRRFWKSSEDADTRAAFLTLWECLTTVTQLTAPFTPFISDEIYTNITRPLPDAPDSVHLTDWPEPNDERADDPLRRRMGLVRKLVGLGRSARTEAKVRVRQPLAQAHVVISHSDLADFSEEQARLVAEELNVKDVVVATNVGDFVTYEVKANFKQLGPRFGKDVKDVAATIANHPDPAALVMTADKDGTVTVETKVGSIDLRREDFDVRIHPKGHTAFAAEGAFAVIIDLDVTEELIAEGIARELVRGIQDLRKTAGLAVEDRIELWLDPSGAAATAAVEDHEDFIANETLATQVRIGRPPTGDYRKEEVALDQGAVGIALQKVADY